MIKREKWVDHTFNLGIEPGWAPTIMARIKGAEIRLVHYTLALNNDQLSTKINGFWSIKEHIGHLIDLENLWTNRFNQFANRTDELVHADMSNQKTKEANHNGRPITELLEDFSTERLKLITCFNKLTDQTQMHKAMHSRLQTVMRPVDLLFFIAEHDDHHIATIIDFKQNL